MQLEKSIVKKLRPIDDVLFHKMAEDIHFCEEIISTILGMKVKVLMTIPQDSIMNLQGRSVILDALCQNEKGEVFNIEVQRANNDNHQKRVRFNASCITANVTPKSTRFEDVPDVCVIYISEFDLFGLNKAVYHVDRVLRENGECVENGLTEIYVYAASTEKNDVSELMELFTKRDSYNDSKFPETSKRKRQFLESEEGVSIMCKELEDYARAREDKGKAEGKAEGKAMERIATLVSVLKKGMPDEQIEDYFHPTQAELAEAKAQL